jgi:mevalonate kinase
MSNFRAHGKLLLSAEYMVMHGSVALALPLKKGQTLEVAPGDTPGILTWTAMEEDQTWFRARFRVPELTLVNSSETKTAERLAGLLRSCAEMKPGFSKTLSGVDVTTRLEFPRNYGWGSSSTLTALLAGWAGIDALELHFRTDRGSGYDVACATASGPIEYRLAGNEASFHRVDFHPPFAAALYFAWLGKKQDTAPHLSGLTGKVRPSEKELAQFSDLTHGMRTAKSLEEFMDHMDRHESLLGPILGMEPVSSRFRDFNGSIKSLGAWGGDFILLASSLDREEIMKYLQSKGIHVCYSFEEIVYGSKRS